jgi:hypothetical protein
LVEGKFQETIANSLSPTKNFHESEKVKTKKLGEVIRKKIPTFFSASLSATKYFRGFVNNFCQNTTVVKLGKISQKKISIENLKLFLCFFKVIF